MCSLTQTITGYSKVGCAACTPQCSSSLEKMHGEDACWTDMLVCAPNNDDELPKPHTARCPDRKSPRSRLRNSVSSNLARGEYRNDGNEIAALSNLALVRLCIFGLHKAQHPCQEGTVAVSNSTSPWRRVTWDHQPPNFGRWFRSIGGCGMYSWSGREWIR